MHAAARTDKSFMFAKINQVFVTVPGHFDLIIVKCVLIIWQVTVDCVSLTLHSFPAPCV